MPKCYKESERNDIISRLKREAEDCMVQYGIKHTTVDELVRRVGIPKGTFYLFYQSKEELLFKVLVEKHELMDTRMKECLSALDFNTVTVDDFTDILMRFYLMIDEVPVLKILNSDEVSLLSKKLPPELIAEHLKEDESMIFNIFGGRLDRTELEPYTAAFRGIFLAVMHKDEFEPSNSHAALRLLIRGIVIQIFENLKKG